MPQGVIFLEIYWQSKDCLEHTLHIDQWWKADYAAVSMDVFTHFDTFFFHDWETTGNYFHCSESKQTIL